MKVDALLERLEPVKVQWNSDIAIIGLHCNSQKIEPGYFLL